MNIIGHELNPSSAQEWDAYVHAHPRATLYHLSGWKNVIETTYGHKAHYLMARRAVHSDVSPDTKPDQPNEPNKLEQPEQPAVGILPLVHMRHFLFGNSLVSIPFFDLGGVLADSEEAESALVEAAVRIAQNLKANTIELRHLQPLSWMGESSKLKAEGGIQCLWPQTERSEVLLKRSAPNAYRREALNPSNPITYSTRSHKVRMLLSLPPSSEALMKSFKAKLRSQIKKPMKDGLTSKIGGAELLDDFYKVFLVNMRDLGSPVHSKRLIGSVLRQFNDQARIVMVYKDEEPLACSMVIGFKDTLENPWASSLREYGHLSPNMLLYWTMMEYACNNGFNYFDFGRSSPDEGTYRFKEQWGAKPMPLNWQYISLAGGKSAGDGVEKGKFQKAIHYWQKLPLPVTRILGPMIRKHIGL